MHKSYFLFVFLEEGKGRALFKIGSNIREAIPGTNPFLFGFYHGLLPERQSHGHGASCFMRANLNSGRLRENKQSCY